MSARRAWGVPLAPLYAGALWAKEALRGKPKRLQWPVVSVGSISAGGAGKTPVVIALAKLLTERGWHVDVLSRGYRREGNAIERVQPEARGAERRFGDEPVLIAQRTGAPVWVGADRFAAGTSAEAAAGASRNAVHLLDDGFQHRQLARTLEIVLVTAEDLDDTLLPGGNLREPPAALKRADIVVVRADEFGDEFAGEHGIGAESIAQRLWPLLREGARMWTVRRTLRFPAPLFVFGAGLRPLAFCAVARPEGFASMLTAAGCGIVETVAFPDHYRYTIADIDRCLDVAAQMNATGFVTTEKDAVKLTPALRERLERVGPLMVVALEAEFPDADAVLRTLEAKLLPQAETA